jgi:hypothetical protein
MILFAPAVDAFRLSKLAGPGDTFEIRFLDPGVQACNSLSAERKSL